MKFHAGMIFACLVLAIPGVAGAQPSPAARVVALKASDGTILKATYFAAASPGPGVLLFHQSNRARKTWDDVAERLAAAGINTLTVDMRGSGDSGGTYDKWKKHTSQSAKPRPLGPGSRSSAPRTDRPPCRPARRAQPHRAGPNAGR